MDVSVMGVFLSVIASFALCGAGVVLITPLAVAAAEKFHLMFLFPSIFERIEEGIHDNSSILEGKFNVIIKYNYK